MTAASDTRPSALCELTELTCMTALATGNQQRAKPGTHARGARVDETSDQALMARVAAADRAAIRFLFERYKVKLYHFVLRLVGNSATAEDIVSEVFLEIWRHAASFQGRAQLSTWILAIARNKAVSAMRGRVDLPLDDTMAEAIPDDARTAEEVLEASRHSAVLRQCLQQLSPAHREIIDLVYYHEKSIDEVSIIVGIPVATVKTRMFYARRRLAESLRAAGIEAMPI